MRYKFFFIPALFPQVAERELNAFLSSNSVLSVDRKFFDKGDNAGWSICVGWSSSSPASEGQNTARRSTRDSIDYREVLSEEDFIVYAGLRDLRKQLSLELAQPVYQIFSNKQLAEMVTSKVRTEKELGEIEGIGSSRLKQFAQPFLALLMQLQSDAE